MYEFRNFIGRVYNYRLYVICGQFEQVGII